MNAPNPSPACGVPRGRAAALAVVLVLVAGVATAPADPLDCEVPLFVQEGTVDANVMLLFDNSGSMNEAMFHPDFDPYQDYSGPYNNSGTYYIYSDGWYRPGYSYPYAYLVSSYGQPGRYRGNYLNWIYVHATDEQRDAIPRETRIDVAHMVVSDIIERSQRVRFGLAKFNYSNFGTIVAGCGTDKDELIYRVNHIQGDAWTPLGEAMETVLNYFKRQDDNGPIQYACQKNFCIVITDGFPTMDRAVSGYLWDADHDGHDPGTCTSIGSPDPDSNDCSDHLDDVAYYLRNTDLRPDLGDGEFEQQNVVTYTIGFGVDAGILQDTADNGDGLYLYTENAAELWTSLELVMLDIISRISTGAAVAVVSTERGTEENLFRGKFMPGSWHGYLESFALPYEDGDHPLWEAGHQLSQRSPSSREIMTGIGGTLMDFDDGEAAALHPYLGTSDTGEAANVIRWTRGEDVAGLRDRSGWVLGDIIHSTPVVVGPPANFSEDPDYQAYMAAHEFRQRMVYVGANDGMLHAFDAVSGGEEWAFVPQFALPKLKAIADTTYCHTYTVDLTPTVQDVKVGNAWRTVLIGGGREGGAGYFALDVTYPYSPELLWQVELPGSRPFASEVEFATIANKSVALIGTGLDGTDGRASVEAYDIATGDHLGSLLLSDDPTRRNKATRVRVVDLNLDGTDDVGYVADLQGHVWRIEFGTSASPPSWSVSCLWAGAYEITSPPTPAFGENNRVYVYFGTGAYLEGDDITSHGDNLFCCVFDDHSGSEYASLVDQTDGIHDLASADGWYIHLEEANGERVTEPAAVVAGTVFFTSFVPSQEPCAAGGESWLYRMDYGNGSVPDDGEEDEWNGNRVLDLDQGIASRPVVDVVNETVIVQSSDATITVEEIGQTFFHLTVRSWRESFDDVP